MCGHVGLTPQCVHRMGGHRVQGRDEASREKVLEDARAIQAGTAPARSGVPGIAEALRGMAFLEAAIASSAQGGAPTAIKPPACGPDLKGLLS